MPSQAGALKTLRLPFTCEMFRIGGSAKPFALRGIPRLVLSHKTENFSVGFLFNYWGETMRKLLLITLMAGGLAFASASRSDAQVYFSIGFGPGYYGYYPYGYYRPYYGYYSRPYWYGGHRYYRHHRYHHYYRY